MSSLTDIDKRYLERMLQMESGYVLDYSDATYGEFFWGHGVDIHGPNYRKYGTSKAKNMRAFWDRATDALVGQVLSAMLDSYEATCELDDREPDMKILKRSREIVARLSGKEADVASTAESFLEKDLELPDVQGFPVEAGVADVIKKRLDEVGLALSAGAHLAVIFLCGSVLEGVLLGAAQKNPGVFNQSSASPKAADRKVRRFHEWSLAQFIDVASDIGLLKPDVKKFSHGLRDFRNYIHPYQQMQSGFSPDQHTAKLCFQVLKAALADAAGER